MTKKHRNSQKRIIFQDAVYFVTLYTKNRFEYFKEKIFCDLFVENLKLCKRLKGFLLYGWVVIYEHVHLQIQPGDEFNISKIMQFLKRHVSRNINIILGYTSVDSSPESDIGQCRFRGDDRIINQIMRHQIFYVLRYGNNWVHIYKFDQYIQQLKHQFQQKYPNNHPFPKFRWQKSFYDHYTRNENDFDEHMEYIANNPAKHNMPDDWSYVYINPKYEDLTDEC